MKNEKRWNRGENPDPKTPPPPPPGSDKNWGGFTPLPEPKYATCIRVFQNGNKVMEFTAKSMEVVKVDKEHIIFYNELGKRTIIYSNDGIIFVQFTDTQE
ncbi:MAG: hypothetical protein IJ272_05390 [Clostridia bacterium]|nr:hypothetical protein [Clostridia bacterium]